MPFLDSTNQTFGLNTNGNFACLITDEGCTQLTECIPVTLGLENADKYMFNMYPNPNSGQFTLELNTLGNNTRFKLINQQGQVVYSKAITTLKTNVMLNEVENGTYIVVISDNNHELRRLLVIER